MFLGLTWLDWLVIVLAVIAGVTGYTQGFLSGLLSFVGFAVGAIGGLLVVPQLLGGLEPGLGTALLAVFLVLVLATFGQAALAWLGRRLRDQLTWRPVQAVDSAAGGVFAAAGVLVAAWALGLAVSAAAIPELSREARESRLLRAIDGVVPVEPDRVLSTFRSVVDAEGFPDVVAPFVPEDIRAVDEPSPMVVRDPEVRAAMNSVVKLIGRAPACDANFEGSGFVISAEHVMTNAHVVAGVRRLFVEPFRGDRIEATVVYFDPQADVAVVHAPGLSLPALAFRDDAAPGVDAAVAGYPNNGPLRVDEARVRNRVELVGQDIYDDARVTRDVIALRGDVRPGNSGGPLLADDGRVYGVVFAASLSDDDTGYALSPAQVAGAVEQGAGGTEGVSTGDCR